MTQQEERWIEEQLKEEEDHGPSGYYLPRRGKQRSFEKKFGFSVTETPDPEPTIEETLLAERI